MAAWTPNGSGPQGSHVYMSYHDFSINTIWANTSTDSGRTWSQPVDVITDPTAIQASACDTVPAGTAVDPRNGWVYVAWTAGSSADNAATGCNYTQGAVFNSMWVAVSKDSGATWTDSEVFAGPGPTAPEPSDMSEIFASLTVDRQGGVYVTFPAYLHGEYDAYIDYSPAADASSALHFGAPIRVNPASVHTAYYIRAVAGDRGRIDVMYFGSPTRNLVVTPQNKATYNGSNPNQPNCTPEAGTNVQGARFIGKPCQMPASAKWYLYLAQSLDLTSAHPHFVTVKARPDSVHTGDICTLGIFCLPGDDRDLADVNDIKVDSSGGVQVAYGAENLKHTHTEIDFQCQRSGPGLYARVKVRDCQAGPASPGHSSPVTSGIGALAGLGRVLGRGAPVLLWAGLLTAAAAALRRRPTPQPA
jgi:hypothetical protein